MDASNQEGIEAGKQASGRIQADPGSYFDNFSADAPQRSYYGGVTQTDSSIAVHGEAELHTSELGQTAQEAYINNPADSISPDSDMMKHSDEVRSNAEAIAGGDTGQCVAQELSKTTYTTHQCDMASDLNQSCTRKATITTTGSPENVQTRLVLDARSVAGRRIEDYWLQYDILVPEDGTLSSGSWELLYPSSPGYHGDRLDYSIQAFGQTLRAKMNNSGAFVIAPQTVTQGQVISLRIRYNTDGHHNEAASGLLNSVASGTIVVRITLPMEVVRETLKPVLQWTNSCPADMGDAVWVSEVCSDPGGERTVVLGGIPYTLYSDCWAYTTQWNLYENDTNSCQAYIDNPNCSEGTRICAEKIGNYCVFHHLTWQCAHTEKSTGYVCGSEFYCSDGSCAAMQAGESQNFEAAVSQLAALAAAGKEFAGMDSASVRAFTGRGMACRKSAAGFSNCCKSGGWGHDVGLAHCNSEEQQIGTGKEKKLVVSVGSYCARKVLGVCLQKKEGYCVFDSKLARILQVQGRRDQLGIGFGTGENPDCRGISISELQQIRFDRLDFTDFYDDLNNNVELPDQEALRQRILSDIQNSLRPGGGG
jgi:conjugal transfer mating pair stabilization protein TraN